MCLLIFKLVSATNSDHGPRWISPRIFLDFWCDKAVILLLSTRVHQEQSERELERWQTQLSESRVVQLIMEELVLQVKSHSAAP